MVSIIVITARYFYSTVVTEMKKLCDRGAQRRLSSLILVVRVDFDLILSHLTSIIRVCESQPVFIHHQDSIYGEKTDASTTQPNST